MKRTRLMPTINAEKKDVLACELWRYPEVWSLNEWDHMLRDRRYRNKRSSGEFQIRFCWKTFGLQFRTPSQVSKREWGCKMLKKNNPIVCLRAKRSSNVTYSRRVRSRLPKSIGWRHSNKRTIFSHSHISKDDCENHCKRLSKKQS